MKEIIVMGSPLILQTGIVKLTEKQARVRYSHLKPYKKKGRVVQNCYEITDTVCFKVGETIGYAGDTKGFYPDMVLKVEEDKKNNVIAELKEKIKTMEAEKVVTVRESEKDSAV